MTNARSGNNSAQNITPVDPPAPLRAVKAVHPSIRDDIGDLITRRALPTQEVGPIDPFLLLNHHGPQVYPENHRGLPFGPHPHRGFETVTFILKGDLQHRDSGGHRSIIRAGGVQWMTAGRGIIHAEESSSEFMQKGGALEILQLWHNLPSRLKMTKPRYIGLQKTEIPTYNACAGRVRVDLVSGEWQGHRGPVEPLTNTTLMTIAIDKETEWISRVPESHNVFFYLIRGELQVNGSPLKSFELLEFENSGESIEISATKDSLILFGHAEPYREPIVAHGPFVMNSREQIRQAVHDYQSGQFE